MIVEFVGGILDGEERNFDVIEYVGGRLDGERREIDFIVKHVDISTERGKSHRYERRADGKYYYVGKK